jgi:endonuclease/exonuclease/phosphatase family metal-dependent hydrolase
MLCYNLHLESRSNNELRLAQLTEVLRDSAKYDSAWLVILAGDLNLNASMPGIAGALAEAGFRDAVPSARLATTPARHLLEAGRHIDWAFLRGIGQAESGKVHRSVTASDHYPISFELRFPG